MEKTTLEESNTNTLLANSKIEKHKLITEYNELLLRRASDSKRPLRDEPGLTLVEERPNFRLRWVEFVFQNGHMEGWEKLCVEAYCIGWLDFFDNLSNREHKIYFDWRDESEAAGRTRVTIYIDEEKQGLTPPTKPPQPPPPPMG